MTENLLMAHKNALKNPNLDPDPILYTQFAVLTFFAQLFFDIFLYKNYTKS